MRPPTFVPESKPVDELLREMQAQRTTSRSSSTSTAASPGCVTIEDILEEIVGEIADEYDAVSGRRSRSCPTASMRVTARLPVEDLAELFDVELPEDDDVETVGGLLARALGRVPIEGADGRRRRAAAGRRDHRRPAQPDRHAAGAAGCPRTDDAEPTSGAAAGATRPSTPAGRGRLPAVTGRSWTPRTRSWSPWPARPAAAPAPPRGPPSATPTAAPTWRPTVALPSLRLSALQAAVAAAVVQRGRRPGGRRGRHRRRRRGGGRARRRPRPHAVRARPLAGPTAPSAPASGTFSG